MNQQEIEKVKYYIDNPVADRYWTSAQEHLMDEALAIISKCKPDDAYKEEIKRLHERIEENREESYNRYGELLAQYNDRCKTCIELIKDNKELLNRIFQLHTSIKNKEEDDLSRL